MSRIVYSTSTSTPNFAAFAAKIHAASQPAVRARFAVCSCGYQREVGARCGEPCV